MRRLHLAFLTTLALCSTALGAVDSVQLIKQLADVDSMPVYRNYTTHLVSSVDMTGANMDWGNFVSTEGETAVLADLEGPGAVTRIWSANAHLTGNVRIYIDDNPKPVIDAPFADLFRDKVAPFNSPLSIESSGGYISYLPIPYAKRCRIVVDNHSKIYYQVGYIKFPQGTEVESFDGQYSAEEKRAFAETAAKWSNAGSDTAALLAGQTPFRVTASPGSITPLAALQGPGRIKALGFRAPEGTDLRKLVLRGYFDEHSHPDIESPVADFFGSSFHTTGAESLFTGRSSDGMLMFSLPMPFARTARFTLENGTGKSIAVELKLAFEEGPFDPQTTGYLHGLFMQEKSRTGEPHRWLNIENDRGHFVGQVQSMSGKDLWFLEGDELFRVDTEKWTPSQIPETKLAPWQGTGAEDYYNSGWYFLRGTIHYPTHGAVVRTDRGEIGVYRWHLIDTVNFNQSIDAELEHGGTNDTPGTYYSSTVFWYSAGEAKPRAPMPKAETLFVPSEFVVPPHNDVVTSAAQPGFSIVDWDHFGPALFGGRLLLTERSGPTAKISFAVLGNDRYALTLHAAKSHKFDTIEVGVDGKWLKKISVRGENDRLEPIALQLGELDLAEGEHVLEIRSASEGHGFAVAGLASPSTSPLITKWQLSTVYPNPGYQGYDTVYEPENYLLRPWDLKIWKPGKATSEGWFDILAQTNEISDSVIYAYTRIDSARAFETQLLLGSDDGVKVWINGEQVHGNPALRPMQIDEDRVPILLKQGENIVVIKILQGEGAWRFSTRILDPERYLNW